MKVEKHLKDAMGRDQREIVVGFESDLEAIALGQPDRAARIAELRRRMDAACDVGELTIKEWRGLIEKVSLARAESPARGAPSRA